MNIRLFMINKAPLLLSFNYFRHGLHFISWSVASPTMHYQTSRSGPCFVLKSEFSQTNQSFFQFPKPDPEFWSTNDE